MYRVRIWSKDFFKNPINRENRLTFLKKGLFTHFLKLTKKLWLRRRPPVRRVKRKHTEDSTIYRVFCMKSYIIPPAESGGNPLN